MSRIRRISYAITPEGHRANATKQAVGLRDKVLSIVDDANFSTSTARKITKKAAFSVVMRSLEESKGLPLSLREHLAMKELNKYISLAKHNKSDFFYASNTDLLPISHPRSTREHSMTASALRTARSRWFAADPRITDERAKAVLASAFESIPGSVEHLYYTSILLSLPQGIIPGDALIAASDGNSSSSRSERARRQRRDSKGRFAYEGGGIRALIRRLSGDIFSISGRVVANAKNSRDVEVEFPDGKIAEINPAKGEYIKAVLPTPDGYSPNPVVPSVTDEVIDEKDLVFVDAPNGWNKDENYNELGDKVEKYVDSAKEFAVYLSKQDDGSKEYKIVNAASDEEIAVVKTWADVQDKLEGNEDQLLNPKAKLPEKDDFFPYKDKQGPNAYEKLMAEKKDRENAIANRETELKKNAEDRVDALDRKVPEGWDINQKNNALMLRRQTEPADLENIYKQNNFVARVIEQGEISVKDVNGLLEEKMYENWASVEKDKDARATEYAQKAREEIKKFAAPYGYSEEDLKKIDSMSAEEISSFFLDEKLQPEGFADALDDYMTSNMVDAPSERQKVKWKSFGEKLKLINDAGDFPGTNAPIAELPKQPDAPVETTKGGFEYNYPDGAYKINQASEYDIQGRVDEESPDFTDDPVELAQKQDERDILAALEQAVSPRENGENALGVGALPFNRGDEFVPAEALFFALQEAGVDAPMELAKIYDKKLGNDSNEKALNDFRKKAEIVSGNIPELAESFKKVTEQNPDLELPTEASKFDAEAVELIPLPPLLDGLSQKELDQFMETKDHTPYLLENEDIEMPEGYNPLSPEPFAAWKEVTAENPDAILPEGFSDNPVYLAQEIPTNNLLKELRRSVEPGNEVPGAAVVAFPTDDDEDFVANVPGEAVRDALQLQGVDTNAELRKIAEEGLAGQVDEVFEVPELPTEDAPEGVIRLVVDGDVPLEKQIRDAIAAKLKVAFLYNDVERVVLPVEIFENPKNSNVNMRAIDANGDRKTFTLSKIENSKIGAPAAPIEITDKEIFDRRMAGESLQDLADALGIPREEVRAREAKYLRENPQDSNEEKPTLPEGYSVVREDNPAAVNLGNVNILKDGDIVGFLNWNVDNKVIENIEIKPEHRGKRLAQAAWAAAKEIEPELKHAQYRTPAGDRFAHSTGDYVPPLIPMGNWTQEELDEAEARAKAVPQELPLNEKNIVGDYKPTADQINKLQKGIEQFDWIDDGIMFLKVNNDGPRADAPTEIYDDNGLPEDGPFAKIDVDGNFEWKDKAAYDKYADRLKDILNGDLAIINDNQEASKPSKSKKEIPQDQKVRFSQLNEKEQAEILRNNAEVEALAIDMAGIKAEDVKVGDFLKHRQLNHWEKVVRIEEGKELGLDRVIFYVYNPIAGKEQPRPFQKTSPLEFVRRVDGEGPIEKFPVGKARGRGRRKDIRVKSDPLERVKIREGRVAPAIDIEKNRGFFNGADGQPVLKGDIVIHAKPAEAARLGRGIVKRRVGDQVDEGKKAGAIPRQGKARLDYVWVQWENEDVDNAIQNDGARLIVAENLIIVNDDPAKVIENLNQKPWKGGVAKPNNRGAGRKNPVAVKTKIPEVPKPAVEDVNPRMPQQSSKELIAGKSPGVDAMTYENLVGEIKKMRLMLPKARADVADREEDKLKYAGKQLDKFMRNLKNKNLEDGDFLKTSTYELRQAIAYLNRNKEPLAAEMAAKLTEVYQDFVAKRDAEKIALDAERAKKAAEPLPDGIWPDADSVTTENLVALFAELEVRLPSGGGYESREANRGIQLIDEELKKGVDILSLNIDNMKRLYSGLNGSSDATHVEWFKNLKPILQKITEDKKKREAANRQANIDFIDPIAKAEERISAGENIVDASNIKEFFAKDDVFAANPFLEPFKEELQNFFAPEQAQPLAKLSSKARQALNQYLSGALRDNKALVGATPDQTDKNIREVANFILALRAEELAYSPNRNNVDVAQGLKNINPDKIFKYGRANASRSFVPLIIDGVDTGFLIKLNENGVNARNGNNFWLIDTKTGQKIIIKKEIMAGRANAEVWAAKLLNAFGVRGVSHVERHPQDDDIIFVTFAGDNLDLVDTPNVYDKVRSKLRLDAKATAARAKVADLIGMMIFDGVASNTDRHEENFLAAETPENDVARNGNEDLQLLPIDHGFAHRLSRNGSGMYDPETLLRTNGFYTSREIYKELTRSIGGRALHHLIDLTVQQAIQELKRDNGGIDPAVLNDILSQLDTLRNIVPQKWAKDMGARE